MCKKLILLSTVFLVLGGVAQAGIYVWTGDAGDGLWDTPGNWTVTDSNWTWPNEETGDVFINLDALVIDIINGQAVTRGNGLRIQGSDGVTPAVLTLDNASSLSVTGRLSVGKSPDGQPQVGELNVLGGSTLIILAGDDGDNLQVADDAGSVGTVNIVGSTVEVANQIVIDEGTGTINITDSTITLSGGHFTVGNNEGCVATVNIDGASVIELGGNDLEVGDGGEAHVTISGNTIINCDDLYLNEKPGSLATLDVSGSAVITTGDDILVGDETGESIATIGGNAVINVGDDPFIADTENSQGTLIVTDNAVFNMGDDLTIADDAGSIGHMIITGNATVNAPDEFYLADAPTAYAILDVNGTATLNVGDDLDVGEDGPAVCNIGENATVIVGDTIYIPHNQQGIEARMTISGNATVTCDDLQVVNDGGNTGFLHISGNPTITMNEFLMNNDAGDPGTSEVIMDGGTVTVNGNATINDDNPGTATFTLNGGTFYCSGYLNVSDNLDGTAHLTINSGKMITADRLRLGKDDGEDIGQVRVVLNGGLLQAEELDEIMITDTQIIAAGGTLAIGSADVNEVDMQQLIDDGTIVLDIDGYFIVTDGDYTVLAAKAYSPTPGDYAAGVFPTPTITTYISDDVPKTIQDLQPTTPSNTLGRTTSLLKVADSVTIKDLNVELDIRMPGNNADLNVFLTSPDGKQVELFTDVGFNLDDFRNTILDDEASKSIRDGSQPFTGAFKPEGRLRDFDGRNTAGDWVLKIEDDWRGGVGTLNAWRIVVQSPFVLGWKPAPDAASQDVYFSGSFDEVNDRADAAFLGNVAGDAGSTDAPALDYDTTYYWVVDSLDPNGVAEPGQVWTFTTGSPSETAQVPSPADGAVDVVQDTLVTWEPGASAAGREVFFGTAENPPSVGLTTGTSYDPGKLVVTTTYYWKVDEIEADGTRHEGPVWSFTTVIGEAIDPYPANQTAGVPVDVVVSWTPGGTAVSHDGYFGTTSPPAVFVGNTTETSFDTAEIGGLEPDTVYYWQLNAIEEDGTTHVGEIWSFKTAGPNSGAKAQYFKGMNFEEPVLTRTDMTIDFDWGEGEPDPAVGVDQFSVRWIANLVPAFSDTYTLATETDDGVRVWLDGDLIIDNWTDHGSTWDLSDPIDLVAGESYVVQMEWYENGGGAVARLYWESPTTARRPIGALQIPLFALDPDPADGATVEQTFALLQWTAGPTAASHNVYVSESKDDVVARAEAAFGLNVTLPTLSVGLPGLPIPDGLGGATYYWAVDEVEADPNVVYAGPVWSFTVPPVEAYDPSPADGAENVDPAGVTLSWTAGLGAKLHSVYFGDDLDTVTNAVGAPPLPLTTFATGPLAAGTTYYWRVDEFNPPNNITGKVWSFTTAP